MKIEKIKFRRTEFLLLGVFFSIIGIVSFIIGDIQLGEGIMLDGKRFGLFTMPLFPLSFIIYKITGKSK